MRATLLALCLTAGLVAVPRSAIGAEEGLRIRHVSVDDFPKVEVVVSSSSALDTTDLEVKEGNRAIDAEITPLGESGQRVDVVLLIDTSGSMLGEPMSAAQEAATEFVNSVPGSVRVGVATFADKAHRVVGLEATKSEAVAAITGLTPAGETSLFDGVELAAEMFRGDAQRNIVLLSDGGDTASKASLRDASETATDADAAVFSVGLQTEETDIAALEDLSAATGGRFEPAETADLSRIYDSLADELASQFAISFTSDSASGSDIAIGVTAPTGEDLVTVLAPGDATATKVSNEPAQATPVEAPEPLPSWALPLTLALCFLAIFAMSLAFVGARNRKQSQDRIRRALHDAVGNTEAEDDDEDESGAGWLPDMVVTAGGKVASQVGMRETVERNLERAGIALRSDEFMGLSLAAALLGFVIGALLMGSLLLAAVLAVLGAVGPTVWLRTVIEKRLNKLNDQLPDILTVLAGSLRAGHSFLQALDMAAREVDDPGATEFQRLVAEIRLGRTVDEALDAMGERISNEGLSWAILAVKIQREVGGNLAELLDTVAETLRTREALKRQVRTLSAEGRLSMYVIGGLPIAIGAYMAVVNPDYLALLYETQLGRVMLASGACLLVAGFLWMKRVVTLDV